MTHLIIALEDIEKEIKSIRTAIDNATILTGLDDFIESASGDLLMLSKIKNTNKQIDLSDAAIEERAKEFASEFHGDYDNDCTEIAARRCYKQALKDLLK